MSNVIRLFRPGTGVAKPKRHELEGLERVTTPPIETSNYEFMLENLMDLPSDRFDRSRNRMPQGLSTRKENPCHARGVSTNSIGMISQRARYAFKAMVALARAKPGVGLQIRELSEQEKLPRKFLEQILLLLKAAGYITSRRGRDGGYNLLKPADLIYIGPMLRAVDGPIAPLSCLSRTAYRRCDDCKDEVSCELRMAFAKAYGEYLASLETTSLAQVMRQSDAAKPDLAATI